MSFLPKNPLSKKGHSEKGKSVDIFKVQDDTGSISYAKRIIRWVEKRKDYIVEWFNSDKKAYDKEKGVEITFRD